MTDNRIKGGQFVFKNDNDRLIRGFIQKVELCSFDVILWEPEDIGESVNIVNLSNSITPEQLSNFVEDMLMQNNDMIPIWQKASENKMFIGKDKNDIQTKETDFKQLENDQKSEE